MYESLQLGSPLFPCSVMVQSTDGRRIRIPQTISNSVSDRKNVHMTVEELRTSAQSRGSPPAGLSAELQALWYAKADQWEEAHNIAQEIHTATGSWIHALLHLIEGDTGNAGYWFRKAGRPTRSVSEIDELWAEISGELLEP